jgi:hypothetical protein
LQIASFSRAAATAASSSGASAPASLAAASARFPSARASVRGAGGPGGGTVDRRHAPAAAAHTSIVATRAHRDVTPEA